MATHPIENEPSPSKTGVHDVPELTVFQTPPTVATYQVLRRPAGTAMSMMRPLVTAGPIDRSSRPVKVPGAMASAFSAREDAEGFLSAVVAGGRTFLS